MPDILSEHSGSGARPHPDCPTWCDGNHIPASEAETTRHWRAGPGDYLPELRSPRDRAVVRPDGGWDLSLEEIHSDDGSSGPRVVLDAQVHDPDNPGHGSSLILPLTPGEARTLAAQLVGCADRLDFDGLW
jgi:uncharacterized protein DUF6907